MSQFAPEDRQGSIDFVSDRDITFESDRDQDGAGDIVFRTGGVERARLNHDGTGTGPFGGVVPDVVAPAPTGTAATDTANLQAAIDDTPTGGFLLIPGHPTDKANPYVIDSALTISKNIRIEGRSVSEVWAGSGIHLASSLLGAVISQATPGTDVLDLTAAASKSVWLKNLGLTWDAAIADSDTGHGVNGLVATVHGTAFDSGIVASRLKNLVVLGHDGDHYGFALRNIILAELVHLRSYGGGCLWLDGNSSGSGQNYGNLQIEALFGNLSNSGTADGIHISITSGAMMNLVDFGRPQINIAGDAQNTTQAFFNVSGSPSGTLGIYLNEPDFEPTGLTNPINFNGRGGGIVLRSPQGLGSVAPTNGYDQASGDYISYTTAGSYTFVVPSGVRRVRVRVVGGGGGGGGGGSNASAAANVGGGGGGAGQVTESWVTVSPGSSNTVTVGAGGAGGTGGASGGNAGTHGSAGGLSNFANRVEASGGSAGAGGVASGTTVSGGGQYGGGGVSGQPTTAGIPGNGGPSSQAAIPSIGTIGGAGGGTSSTTLGGGGGSASTVTYPAHGSNGAGGTGSSGAAAGVNGTTATTNGCGGGGGGGAPSGGKGGDGGTGADGMVEISW